MRAHKTYEYTKNATARIVGCSALFAGLAFNR